MTREVKTAIGQRLAHAIHRAGISQAAVARQLNVSPGALSRWVTGANQPPLETLATLCRLVGASADEVLGLGGPAGIPMATRLTGQIDRLALRIRHESERAARVQSELQREVAALRAEVDRLKG